VFASALSHVTLHNPISKLASSQASQWITIGIMIGDSN
jgi:hypothetical protein